ncbi:M14 family zinc carboxypeptidase [Colwellia sp. MEBiC06753]
MNFQQFLAACVLFLSTQLHAASLSYFLGNEQNYNVNTVKPAEVLGFDIGDRHARHDQLVDYLTTLAAGSDRIIAKEIGRTYQHRKQLLLTISSPQNLANLDNILAKRSENPADTNLPIVVWLGYSVHGDEISGAHAAMVVAYHLAASTNVQVKQLLDDVIVVMEPSINPDGMDRFANWVATFGSETANSDPNHIEHHQNWPTGRTNHYWFDLNRDWLLLTQQESVNRLKAYHQYQPNVLGDFHEMGANSSYFFQPGVPTRTNPITPAANTKLTQAIAQYHAKALDTENRLYYSEESFDDFYYGKGSTYPDVNGGVGILFEQASSRGMQQETINGLLTFEYGIKNHVLTSLSTLEGAWNLRKELADYRKDFYDSAIKQAKKEKFVGYLFHEDKDISRLNLFLSKLNQHQIEVYSLSEDFRLNTQVYPAKNSYFVPLAQRQYRVIKALFSQQTEFNDNTFYDVSGWTLPLAMNIEFSEVQRTWGLKLATAAWRPEFSKAQNNVAPAYAYAIEWHDYFAPKLLNKLLANGIKVKVATKAFSSEVNGELTQFQPGTLVIPAGIQQASLWQELIKQLSVNTTASIVPISTGLTPSGIDLGSNSFRVVEPVKTLLIGGKGVSQYEAGEIRYYLDQELEIPVTVIEKSRIGKIDLTPYSHIIFVDGDYSDLTKKFQTKLTTWLKNGGVVFAQKRAASWLADKEILKTNFVSKSQINQLFDTENLSYADKEALSARKLIAGTIFEADVDLSHPLMFGYQRSKLPIFKNSNLIMERSKVPFSTVAKFPESPLLSGYSDKNLVNRLAHNASIVAHNVGEGRVIATTEILIFRGYWQGTSKILANSLFFAKAFNVPASN